MIHSERGERGFVSTILLIVIALIVLAFLGYNLREVIDSPEVRENLLHVRGIAVTLWKTFIVAPTLFLWGKIQGLR